MHTTISPKRKHYPTVPDQPTSPIKDRSQKNKTSYSFLQQPQSIQTQYANLAIQSLRKHYRIGNLKPYSINKQRFQQLKHAVSILKQIQPQIHLKYSINKTINLRSKIKLFTQNIRKKQKYSKLKKLFTPYQSSSQNLILDDHQLLMQDYLQDMKIQQQKKIKTLKQLNTSIMSKYSQLIDSKNVISSHKIQLLKFNQSSNYRKILSKKKNIINKNWKHLLDIHKDDYGIYSISANRTFYYKQNYIDSNKSLPSHQLPHFASITKRSAQKSKKFYQSYMGSYSQRKRILKSSQNMLKQ